MVSVRCGPRFGTELSLASFMGPPPPMSGEKSSIKRNGHLTENIFQTRFKLPAKLCSGYKRGKIKKIKLIVKQFGRYIFLENPACETFRNCGFADTGFTEQNGIVF